MSSIEFRKDLFADERDDNLHEIGKPTIRQDILGHVTGRSPFYDDHLFDGLLHMRCVRSPHHHARIRSIDFSAAQRTRSSRPPMRTETGSACASPRSAGAGAGASLVSPQAVPSTKLVKSITPPAR